MKKKVRLYFAICILFLAVTVILSISLGSVNMTMAEIINTLLGRSGGTQSIILLKLRLPRTLQAAVVGFGLAIAGTFFQGLFRNPMADPYVLGISSGAAFGATIGIVLGYGFFGIGFTAFLTALATICTVYVIAKQGTKISMTTMLLAGITLSTFLHSIISLMMLLAHDQLSRIVFWTMGGFGYISWREVIFSVPLIILSAGLLFFYARDLNVLITGDEAAEHLGIDTERLKKIILVIGSLITAVSVSISGIIGFVGLIVPHIARLIIGPDNRVLVPFSALFGAGFMVLADTLARILIRPSEMPVGIITAALGGPFFIYLLVKNKKQERR